MKLFYFLFVVALCTRLFAAEEKFSVQPGSGFVDIQYAGAPVATYVYRDLKIHRPYFARLFAPGGRARIARQHEARLQNRPAMTHIGGDRTSGPRSYGVWAAL